MKDSSLSSSLAVISEYESNARSYARQFPTVFHRAQGSEIWDLSDRRFVDFFAGAGVMNYGHNPERVIDAVRSYLDEGAILHALDATTRAKADLLRDFAAVILQPRHLPYKIQFSGPAGTDAVEAALKLARRVTGRSNVIAFCGAYHGMTLGSMSVTGSRGVRATAGVALGPTTFVPFFDGPGGPFDAVGYLEAMLDDPLSGVDPPAAVIVETVQMEGGVYAASDEQLRALRELCDRREIVLIFDDIQAGCGRTGRFFSFERSGVVPDLVTVSKALGGAGFPIAAVLIRPEFDQWSPGDHTGTFRGHQLSFVAARAALSFWSDPAFEQQVASSAARMERRLREMADRRLDVQLRGRGLAWGIDMTLAGGSEAARTIARRCFDAGLIVEAAGREGTTIKLSPPLTISPSLLDEGCDILAKNLAQLE